MQNRRVARYVIRRFGLRSLLGFGFVLGIAAGFVPSLAATLAVVTIASSLRRFLAGLRNVGQSLPVINQRISFDFVSLLNLSGAYQSLAIAEEHPWLVGIGLFLLLLAVVAVSFGIALFLSAIVYNVLAKTTGGLEIELEETPLSASKERINGHS